MDCNKTKKIIRVEKCFFSENENDDDDEEDDNNHNHNNN